MVFRGDPTMRDFVAFWLRDGWVAAGMSVNVWGVTESIESLIRAGEPVDVGRLRDPETPLQELAPRSVLREPERRREPASPRVVVSPGLPFPGLGGGDRLSNGDATPASELPPAEAGVLEVGGEKYAVYRDPEGALHALSPVCTHLGCLVDWNDTEKTWDCPCHGSRFDVDGRVIEGPAKRDLERRELSTDGPPASPSGDEER